MREETGLEGTPRLFCAQMRFMRSAICWMVGARVMEAKWSGRRDPGGTAAMSLTSRWQYKKLLTYLHAQATRRRLAP